MEEAGDFYSTHVVNCVLNGFLSSTAIMLNIVTIHAVRKNANLTKGFENIATVSVTLSDLADGLLVKTSFIVRLVMQSQQNTKSNPKYNVTLRIIGFFNVAENLFLYVTFFGVVALSADRFLAVRLHFRYQELVTPDRVTAVVISISVFSAFLSALMQ